MLENYCQTLNQAIAYRDRYIHDVDELKKAYAELQEQVAENGRGIDKMVKGTKELKDQAEAIGEQLATSKKEIDAKSADTDAELK